MMERLAVEAPDPTIPKFPSSAVLGGYGLWRPLLHFAQGIPGVYFRRGEQWMDIHWYMGVYNTTCTHTHRQDMHAVGDDDGITTLPPVSLA